MATAPPLDNPLQQALLAHIYEGVLQDQPWQTFLPLLRQAMDAHAVSLVLRPPAAGDRGVILNCRRNEDGSETLADPEDWEAVHYREQFFAIDPFVNLPPDRAITMRELVPDAELLRSEYYRNYLKPIGLFHILGVDTVEPGGSQARLRIARQRAEDAFGPSHKALCEALLPHLRRAIQIHARLNRTESERDLYAGTVNQLAVATVILDERCRVLSHNPTAGKLLEQKDGLRVIDNHLALGSRADSARLAELLQDAVAAQRAGTTGMARALRVPRPSGLPDLGLVIRPVPTSEWAEGHSPCIAVFISDPQQRESASEQLLSELFQLTPAESRLAIKLARGLSLAQLSQEQNISQHTARAQLKSVFAKTGVTRQAELVRLVLKSVATLG